MDWQCRECGRLKKRDYYRNDPAATYSAVTRQRGATIHEEICPKRLHELRGGTCQYCRVELDYWDEERNKRGFTVDHRVPLSRGGVHSYENCVISCMPCNSSKSDMTEMEWRMSSRPRALTLTI